MCFLGFRDRVQVAAITEALRDLLCFDAAGAGDRIDLAV
jgi:hypothetical protein